MMGRRVVKVLFIVLALTVIGESARAQSADRQMILNNKTLWRTRVVRERDEVIMKSGEVLHAKIILGRNDLNKAKTVENFKVEKMNPVRLPEHTSPEWMRPDFDDSSWGRVRMPVYAGQRVIGKEKLFWKKMMIRAWFDVADPGKAEGLSLSINYRGGVVVYLNGEELTRSHMPKGDLDPYANAEGYGKESFLRKDGYVVAGRKDKEFPEIRKHRDRSLENFKIPEDRVCRLY